MGMIEVKSFVSGVYVRYSLVAARLASLVVHLLRRGLDYAVNSSLYMSSDQYGMELFVIYALC